MRALADYRALREHMLRPAETAQAFTPDRAAACALLDAAGPVLCEWQAAPLLAAYGIGGGNAGGLAHSAAEAQAAAEACAGPVALKVQSADILHKTEAGAVALDISADAVPAAYHGFANLLYEFMAASLR